MRQLAHFGFFLVSSGISCLMALPAGSFDNGLTTTRTMLAPYAAGIAATVRVTSRALHRAFSMSRSVVGD